MQNILPENSTKGLSELQSFGAWHAAHKNWIARFLLDVGIVVSPCSTPWMDHDGKQLVLKGTL